MYNLRLSHLLANHQLADHVWCQHTLPWLWLSRTKGEEGQPAEDKGHVHQDESSPDRKSSRASFHFWFFHRRSREERRILFGDHRPSVACTVQLDTGHCTVQLDTGRGTYPVHVTNLPTACNQRSGTGYHRQPGPDEATSLQLLSDFLLSNQTYSGYINLTNQT